VQFFEKVSSGVPYLYFCFSLIKNKRMYRREKYRERRRKKYKASRPKKQKKRGKHHEYL